MSHLEEPLPEELGGAVRNLAIPLHFSEPTNEKL